MYLEGVEPNPAYFVGVSIMALEEGRCVYEQIIQSGYKSDVIVGNCLIDMYAKCGSIEDAWRVFNRMTTHDGLECHEMWPRAQGSGAISANAI